MCLQPINRRRVGSPSKDHSLTINMEVDSSGGESSVLDNESNLMGSYLGPDSPASNLDNAMKSESYYMKFSPPILDLRHRIHLDRRSWLEVKDPLHR